MDTTCIISFGIHIDQQRSRVMCHTYRSTTQSLVVE